MIKNNMSLKTLLREQPKEIEDIILSYYDDLVNEEYRPGHKMKMKLVLVEWGYITDHYIDTVSTTRFYLLYRHPPPIIKPYCLRLLSWRVQKFIVNVYINLGLNYCPSNICLDYFSDKFLIVIYYYLRSIYASYMKEAPLKKIVKNIPRRKVIHLILKSMDTKYGFNGNVFFSDDHPLPINIEYILYPELVK